MECALNGIVERGSRPSSSQRPACDPKTSAASSSTRSASTTSGIFAAVCPHPTDSYTRQGRLPVAARGGVGRSRGAGCALSVVEYRSDHAGVAAHRARASGSRGIGLPHLAAQQHSVKKAKEASRRQRPWRLCRSAAATPSRSITRGVSCRQSSTWHKLSDGVPCVSCVSSGRSGGSARGEGRLLHAKEFRQVFDDTKV